MSNRADDIRRRHQERKKRRVESDFRKDRPVFHDSESHEERPSAYRDFSEESTSGQSHPLIRKERVILRVMIAAVLFLGVGVMFKNASPAFQKERAIVKNTFTHEFQFAMVSNWYQKEFGAPLALFPKSNGKKMPATKQGPGYAVPVNGTVTLAQNFKDTGQKGILVQTGSQAAVKAVKQGFVSFVGKKKGLGKTVVIQLPDGGEAWYGKLTNVDLKLYDFVKRGEKVGTVTPAKNGKSGSFFFALKKKNAFVNPLKVIHFG